MSLLDTLRNFRWTTAPSPDEAKAAFGLVRAGVQGRPQYPDTNTEALLNAHKRNEIVYAAIKAKATAAVDPRLIVQQRPGDGPWEEARGHPLRRLMMRPNPGMDAAAWMRAAIVSMDIAGVFYAEKVRSKAGQVVELHPLNPAKVAPIPGDGGIAAYEFKDGNHRVEIPAENMLVRREFDLASQYHGLSPLAVALGSVDADSAQTDYVRAFFNNAGVPSGLLKIKGRTLNQSQSDEIKGQWRAKYGRAWGKQHDVAVLDDNAEYQQIGANLDQLESEILREWTETRVCMVFGVPPLIIYAFAGLKRATYSNLKEAWRGFWLSTLTPLFTDWASFLTWSLLTEFADEELIYGERVRLAWDMSQVAALQEDEDSRQNRGRENFKVGGITLNQFREIVGQQADPQGDYYLRTLAQVAVPVGQATTAATGKRSPYPGAVKALADATQPIEARIRGEVEQYLQTQYQAAADAIREAS